MNPAFWIAIFVPIYVCIFLPLIKKEREKKKKTNRPR